jgi:CDP-6-deoxy-D-xylo-4-hexulose-3-dehydrase
LCITGRFADEFGTGFAKFFGRRHAHLVNAGSSANLLALTTLALPELDETARKWGGKAPYRGRQPHSLLTSA